MGEQTAVDHKWSVLGIAGDREMLGCSRPGCTAMVVRIDGRIVTEVELFGETITAAEPCTGRRG